LLRCESSFFTLLDLDARYYDPLIGRFYSNDPIGFHDVHSFNRYAYANNNPYKYVDPDGRSSKRAIPLNSPQTPKSFMPQHLQTTSTQTTYSYKFKILLFINSFH